MEWLLQYILMPPEVNSIPPGISDDIQFHAEKPLCACVVMSRTHRACPMCAESYTVGPQLYQVRSPGWLVLKGTCNTHTNTHTTVRHASEA